MSNMTSKWKERRARFTDEGFEHAACDPQALDSLLNALVKQRRVLLFIIVAQVTILLLMGVLNQHVRSSMFPDLDDIYFMTMRSTIDTFFLSRIIVPLFSLTLLVALWFSCDTQIKALKMFRALQNARDIQ